jgi:hypothetical protein
MIVELQE